MGFTAFERTVSFSPGSGDAKWLEAELAAFAEGERRAATSEGAATPVYLRAVNGRLGAPANAVRAPGPIVYSFEWLSDAAAFGLMWLKSAAPARTGRYRRSFIVTADGLETKAEAIGFAKAVSIVNVQPYSRKIQVGAKGFESRRGLFDAAARRLNREFRGLVKARVVFLRLDTAYRLRGPQGRRRDRQRGSEVTYPAIELRSETVVVN